MLELAMYLIMCIEMPKDAMLNAHPVKYLLVGGKMKMKWLKTNGQIKWNDSKQMEMNNLYVMSDNTYEL